MVLEEENSLYRAFRLAVGVMLSLVVAGYAVGVGMTGGFDNPDHPRNAEQWEHAMMAFVQKSQTPEEILAEMKEVDKESKFWGEMEAEYLKQNIVARIERQRRIAGRLEKVPEFHRISFGNQLKADMEEGLSKLFPDLVDVEIKCVLMQEPDAYEFVGGSAVSYTELMEYLVKVAVPQGWLVSGAMTNDKYAIAYMTLHKAEQTLFVVLMKKEGVFENLPTVVHYSFTTEAYETYEIPRLGYDSWIMEADELTGEE